MKPVVIHSETEKSSQYSKIRFIVQAKLKLSNTHPNEMLGYVTG